MTASGAAPALCMRGVGLTRDGRDLLAGVDLTVAPHDRWVVLGPNGAGKTSLIRIAGLVLHPSRGEVEVLGHRLGRTDVRRLRRRVGLVSAALADALRPGVTAGDVVMTARHGALEPWWHPYDDDDRRRALDCLARLGADNLAPQPFGTLSSGERQRVLLARALMTDPGLLLLDEPAAGLDLGARERLVANLAELAGDASAAPVVFVTHHVEEVPPGFTHVLLLRAGRVLAGGPLEEVLTGDALSETFGLRLALHRRAGRWAATAG